LLTSSIHRPFIFSCAAIYISYSLYSKFVLDPLSRILDEGEELDLPDKADEEEDVPLFIPFPGTTKQLKPVPYRGSDPEWQEFIKFSQDQDLAKRVRGQLPVSWYLE
jgi:hypothetical protein